MKIEINARDLQEMLKISKGLELRKLDLDIQKSLLIKNDTLIMNNRHTQLESKFDINVIESGTILIPESTLKILENFKNGYLIITDKSIKYNTKEIQYVNTYDEGFYTIDDKLDTFLFEVTEKELNHLLEVNCATSSDKARFFLEGIQITKNRFTALNGYYASLRFGSFNIDENILLSKSIWKTLLKTVDKKSDDPVKVFWNSKDLVKFEFENYNVIGELLKDKYPNVEEIIKDNNNTKIKLNTKDLIKSVKLMKKFKGEDQLIDLFINETLQIKTQTDMNIMTDEFELLEFEGQPIEISFNINYFHDVINQFKNKDVILKFSGEFNPMYIETDKCLDFLLPVRKRG